MTLGGSGAAALTPTVAGYELLHELGQGAMGVVWLAREQSLNRVVALKLLRGGSDPQLRQRLLREGQAAARLRHPHIVAVHAMGREGDGAFLAMDYLEGGNLEELVKETPLAPRDSAEIVEKLAGALVCAHEAGVLHRDLKPSNILLDAEGEPHLADFGLAAPVEGAGDLTIAGQVAGTPAYLAPELLQGADRASVQSDLYGLGAVLYHALTGRPPFTGDSTASVLARVASDDPLSPRLLRPDTPRDLETICLKCLEKIPSKRYPSARLLWADLERFRRGEPIAARPVGVGEKSVRWCRRRPGAATSVGLGAALLLVLAVGGPLVAFRLDRSRRLAATEAASSRAVSDFLEHDLLAQASPDNEPNRDLSLRTVVDRASSKVEGRFPESPLVEASVQDTLAATYASLGLYPLAQHHWERALALRRSALGAEDPATVRAMIPLIDCLRAEGKLAEAVELGWRTVALAKRVLGPESLDTLTAMTNLGTALDYQKKFDLAQPITLSVVAARQRLLGPDNPATLLALSNLAFEYEGQGQFAKAEDLCRRVLDARTRVLGLDHPDTLISMNNLGAIYSDEGRLEQAADWNAQVVDRLRRVCGPEHPKTLIATGNWASALRMEGDYAKADEVYRSLLAVRLRILGSSHPSVLLTEARLGETLRLEHHLNEAEAVVRDAWEGRRRVLGAEHPDTLAVMIEMVRVLADQERLGEAETLGRQAVEDAQRVLGPTAISTLAAEDELCDVLLRQDRWDEAGRIERGALAGWMAREEKGWRLSAAQSRLGAALIGLKRYPEAESLLTQAARDLRAASVRIPVPERYVIAEASDRLSRADAALAYSSKQPLSPDP
ncbi:MAG TPA: serine/threonine-protein kinase [Opitutaceae bacterium]